MESKVISVWNEAPVAALDSVAARRSLWGTAYLPESYVTEEEPPEARAERRHVRTRNALLCLFVVLVVVWTWLAILLIGERHRAHRLQRLMTVECVAEGLAVR